MIVFAWIGLLLLVSYVAVGAWMFEANPFVWRSAREFLAPSVTKRARIQRVGLARWYSLLALALVCFGVAGASGR